MKDGKRRLMTLPTIEGVPIYVFVTEKFRNAKTPGELHRVAEKYRPDIAALQRHESEYAIGCYHSIRNAYKYYLNIFRNGLKASPHSVPQGSNAVARQKARRPLVSERRRKYLTK